MCTAVKYVSDDLYFGRTLDNFCSYGEEIVIMPRRRKLVTRNAGTVSAHYAIIGVATVKDGSPLFYDACNEKGLAMAGLNFVGNACFGEIVCGKDNVATFELIPWILGSCATVEEVKLKLKNINITGIAFSPEMPAAQLHWIIADKDGAIVVECEKDGMHVYDNEIGVLANNPPFPIQKFGLNNYMSVSPKAPCNDFSCKIKLDTYSYGMGGIGLPGDLSSQSRFVRAAFTALNSPKCETCEEGIGQMFHILGSVEQVRGCNIEADGTYEITLYTSCCNASKGIYYYTSYNNRRITGVDMHRANIDGTALFRYSMIGSEQIYMQN